MKFVCALKTHLPCHEVDSSDKYGKMYYRTEAVGTELIGIVDSVIRMRRAK